MSCRVAGVLIAAAIAVCSCGATVDAQTIQTSTINPFPGITYITRTDQLPSFQCPGCPRATPTPRLAVMNIVLVDLTAPEVHFKLTPQGTHLPDVLPGTTPAGWPVVPFEVVRQQTLGFLQDAHAQVAINSHFFAPFPVVNPAQGAWAYLIGLAASRGNVYSAFESPVQNYAIVTDAPAINIDRHNNAGVVHRDPNFADGLHVVEAVELYNALAGSAQIVTNGQKTIPQYKDATHPDELLTPNSTYTRDGRHWYDLSNARASIGLTEDNRTLVLFTVDGTNGGHGMQVGEVADVLMRDYGVYNALNLDGGGSTTIAMEDPVTHVKRVMNSPSDNPPRAEASSFAVYSDGIAPVTTAIVTPAPNVHGWNKTSVTVSLNATDLASGINDTPAGWVDQIQYSVDGAQPQVVAGSAASFAVSTTGVTPVSYFATDAAGNDEQAHTLDVRIDAEAPAIKGLPAEGCSLWPPNHKLQEFAVSAEDLLSGVASFEVTATSSETSDPSDPGAVVTADGAGGFIVGLRSERPGNGAGPVYTITAVTKDKADNARTMTATCTVPHDQGR